MGGVWIKMRDDLDSKPEVFQISAHLQMQRLHVVGCLWKVWTWADALVDSERSDLLKGASGDMVDELVGIQGFAETMEKAGWVVINADGLRFPNFSRHNGKSAKARALDNQRKAESRSCPANVRDLSGSCPDSVRMPTRQKPDQMREEKMREEKIMMKPSSTSSPHPAEPGAARPREGVDWDANLRAWNELATRHGRPQVRALTETRRTKLRARLRENPELWRLVDEALGRAGHFALESAWLTFDWCLSPGNLAKLLEGNYDRDREPGPTLSPTQQRERELMRDPEYVELLRKADALEWNSNGR